MASTGRFLDVLPPYSSQTDRSRQRQRRAQAALQARRSQTWPQHYQGRKCRPIYQRRTPDVPTGGFSSCVFLDNADTLALASSWGLDIVRLVQGQSHDDEPEPNEHEDDPHDDDSSAPPSSLSSTRMIPLEARELARGIHEHFYAATRVRGMKALRGGHALAVGLANGNLLLYHTEPAASWATKLPLLQSPLSSISSSSSSSYFTHCRQQGSKRWFDILENVRPSCLLERRQRLRWGSSSHEVHDWFNDPSDPSFTIPRGDTTMTCHIWDFWETTSGFQALHICHPSVHLGLRIVDGRQSSRNNAMALTLTGPDDSTSFLDACFISEHGIATCASKVMNGQVSQWVNIWDMRRMREPVSEIPLSPLLTEKAYGRENMRSIVFSEELCVVPDMELMRNGNILVKSGFGYCILDPYRETCSDWQRCISDYVSINSDYVCAFANDMVATVSTVSIPHHVDECATLYLNSARESAPQTKRRGAKMPRTNPPGESRVECQILDRYDCKMSPALEWLTWNDSGTCLVAGAAHCPDLFGWGVL